MGHEELNTERQIIGPHSMSSLTGSSAALPRLHWLWLCLFVFGVAFLGGSSRPDPIQNALLRPIVALLLIPAFFHLRSEDFARAKAIWLLFAALSLWMILQLVPLPPAAWRALPDRQIIAEIDQLAGRNNVWRPISFAPFRGFDSLFAMLVPVAALLLATALRVPVRILLFAVAGIGLIDASFGLLQVIGGADSPLYLFAITSRDAPAGIFANENHSAVFSAIVLLIVTRLALESQMHKDPPWIRLAFAPAFLFVLLAVLITGSRAGFIAALAALAASAAMAWITMRGSRSDRPRAARKSDWRTPRGFGFLGCSAAILLVLLTFVWLERAPAVVDMTGRTSFEDLRWSMWPTLVEIVRNHWVVGTGFGSFDAVYRIYEPSELLLPRYVNHAHNDWAQMAIEGGLVGILLLAVLVIWIAKSLAELRLAGHTKREQMIFWIACLVIVAGAELVDYPLRTPVFQATFVWLLLCLSSDRVNANKRFETMSAW